MRLSAFSFSSFKSLPTSFLFSAATFLKSLKRRDISPFLLKYFIRKASISSALDAFNASISALSRYKLVLKQLGYDN